MPAPTSAEFHQVRRFALHHSAMLGELTTFFDNLNPELPDLPEIRLLCFVQKYDAMSKIEDLDWGILYRDCTQLSKAIFADADPVVQFFLLNYHFLTLRNADKEQKHNEDLLEISGQAFTALNPFQGPVHKLLDGFISFNVARWDHNRGALADSKKTFAHAASQRIDWYRHARDAREEFIILAAAAEQVRKLPRAFKKMFPEADVAEIGISADLLAEVTKIAPGDREVVKV